MGGPSLCRLSFEKADSTAVDLPPTGGNMKKGPAGGRGGAGDSALNGDYRRPRRKNKRLDHHSASNHANTL
ncbi:hypothetical protein LSTR_LSTR014202 [Laodelphax striatellus]|uniref:Uncharacterized protein n=1 Tax=Laodelphax striatellus TaxID=195883 RepID=A0A482X4M0_LAOST|nr:hypothetical protein LSTR_LSTR015813 [Laodelphax striatellus]RZF40221.1 hypothetical protein LSTR_LSTR014202 [Laodelphax striatellus]